MTILGALSGAKDFNLGSLVTAAGMDDVVTHLPPVDAPELAGWYRSADVVLMPSYSEPFGLVALEAQACGTPVLVIRLEGCHGQFSTAPPACWLTGTWLLTGPTPWKSCTTIRTGGRQWAAPPLSRQRTRTGGVRPHLQSKAIARLPSNTLPVRNSWPSNAAAAEPLCRYRAPYPCRATL